MAGTAAETGWSVCAGCRTMLYGKRFIQNGKVCPECGHHHVLSAAERIAQLLDPDSVEPLDFSVRTADVLQFVDSKPYPQRLAEARRRTGLAEGVLVAAGTIEGRPVVTAVMDFGFLGGSLGAAAGELITCAAEAALSRRVPLLIVTASGGARMQEGPISLMQMAKTSQALARLDEAGVLTVALITDPTFGGVAASFATQCDVIVAEPGARLGFAGRRVIEQTIGHDLPPGFQTAEFLRERGLIDMITPRSGLRTALGRLLAAGVRRPAAEPADPAAPSPSDSGWLVRDPAKLAEIDPWQAVQRARDLDRPTTLDYLDRAFADFEELHGDRMGEECQAIVGGIARLAGRPVLVLGHQKGRTAGELALRNYGMPTPAGYRKAARLMRLAGKLGLPIVTFVDTPGAYPGIQAEERGQAVAIAESIRLMTSLPVPIVTVIIGEGGSGGALALAVADEVLINEHGVYSVISPEGCASILWNDASMAPTAARSLKGDARSLLRMNIVDGVLAEPAGGSQADHAEAARRIAAVLNETLERLEQMDARALVTARRDRFRSYGPAVDERELQVES
ncbi:MAG TPA: acetyl-CoA carboxylase carboxyltransferase subunit alpha [Jatrophihabitans sp.]|nr:acetyl-CoA carboxylase carboxyltransferase subunit alpha [Jatrophihabitans sp.]